MSSRAIVDPIPLHTMRAAASVELGAVVSALAGQSRLGWPVKLSLSRHSGPAVVAELVGGLPCSDDGGGYDLAGVLEHGRAWLATAVLSSGNGDHGLAGYQRDNRRLGEVCEALDSLGWQASESESGAWAIQETQRQGSFSALTPGGRGLLSIGANHFVCFSQSPALIRSDDEECRLAMTTLALEANARLRMARTSIEATGGDDAVLVWWQAVLPIDGHLAGMLEQALAATWVARQATLAAYQALATPALARAYLATLDRGDSQTHTLTDPKEDQSWKQQAAI